MILMYCKWDIITLYFLKVKHADELLGFDLFRSWCRFL